MATRAVPSPWKTWVMVGCAAAVSLATLSCRTGNVTKGLPPELADILPLGEKRPLEVVMASPQGSLTAGEPVKTITVAFNQPMVPLQPVPLEENGGPLQIEPSVAGRFRWKGTATLTFEARDPLPYGTHYKVKVPKGTKSWSAQELSSDYVFEFTTPTPALVGSLPVENNNTALPAGPVFLHFNQPMDPQSATASISLDSGGKSIPFDVRAFKPEDAGAESKRAELEGYPEKGSAYFQSGWIPEKGAPSDQVLILTPKQALAPKTRAIVTLKSGLKGRQGQVGLDKDVKLQFTTYGPLEYTGGQIVKDEAPEDGLRLQFSTGVAPSELAKHIKIEPKLEIPEAVSSDTYASNNPTLYVGLKPRSTYKITVDADLKDRYGQRLGKDTQIQLSTKDLRPALNMPEGMGRLESLGPLKLPMGICNLKSVTVKVAKLTRSQVVEVAQNDKAFSNSNKFEPPGGYTREIKLIPSAEPNKMEDRSIDLTAADGSFVYVWAHPDVENLDGRALVQVSNLGITAKTSSENCVIWVTRLDDAKPVADAEVEILDRKGATLWTGKTDANGTVQARGWADLGVQKKEQYEAAPELFVFAKVANDEAFVRTQGGRTVDTGSDINYDWSQEARSFRGYAFSERGLYKPGEKVELKGSLRELKASQWRLSDQKELLYAVQDSRGTEVTKGTLTLNEFGGFTHTVELSAQCATGGYSVSYSLPEDVRAKSQLRAHVTSAHFQVETFRPAQFEVTVKTDKPYFVMGDKAKADIKGWYLFGAPMNQSAVRWVARIEPANLRPEGDGYDGYNFGPFAAFGEDEQHGDQAKKITEANATLDAQGIKSVDVNLENIDYKGSAFLVVEGTVSSAGRQQLSGRTMVPLHRGDFQIGLRPTTSLGTAGQKMGIDLVTVLPDGKVTGGRKVKLELLRREWKSVRKAGADGRYQWVSEVKDESISSSDVTSEAKSSSPEVTPTKAGYYIVRATSEDSRKNKILSECSFYAGGKDYVGWERREGDGIKLVPDKKGYKPGETAKILIQNPYQGKTRALVTLEREHILERYVQEFEGSSPTLEIPLRSQHLPNVFVSVVLLQGRLTDKGFGPDGEDLGKPSFRIGYCNLPVETKEKHLAVTLKTDKESYAPGDEVTVEADIKDANGKGVEAEFSLASADLGVLNLIGFKTPDYFDTFYGSRSLAVSTSESRMDVIGQRVYGAKGANSGGGGSENDSSMRQDFKYTSYWNPSLRTDAQGHVSVKFKLPDNLTTFRLMAVAQTKGSEFGSGESKFTVKKELMLQPTIPSFARVGDDFSAGVVVHNNSSAAITAEVELKATNLPVVGDTHQSVSVPAGKEKEVLFHFKPDKAEVAELTFSAKAGALQDAVKLKLPLQLPVVSETVSTSSSTTDPSAVELTVPNPIAPGSGFLQVNLASSALVGLQGATLFNLDYSYGCMEQRLSRIAPVLSAQKLVKGLELKGHNEAELKALVEEQLAIFPNFQHEGGGFRIWPDATTYNEPNDYLTAYALEVLADAKQQGYKVDEKMTNKAVAYLKRVLANDHPSKLPYSVDEQWVNRTYALYALSLWKNADVSELNKMFADRGQMPLMAKAYLLQAAYHLEAQPSVVQKLRQELKNSAKIEAATVYFAEGKPSSMPWVYASNRHTTALVLKALVDGKEPFEMAPKVVNWLMENRSKAGHWSDTRTNSAVLDAFASYMDKFEKDEPNFTAKVKVGSEEILSQSFKGRRAPVARKVVSLSAKDDKMPVRFEKNGKGRLYYDLRMTYATLKEQPARDEGLAIFKSISDTKTGKKLSEFKAGDSYLVTLSVVTPVERHFVVLADPVPAGFEVVQTNFDTESNEMFEILKKANQKTPGYTFGHFEKYSDRVLLFADGLGAGEHTFRYLIRANQPGTFLMPSSKGEEMYHPEVFGITAPMKVVIH